MSSSIFNMVEMYNWLQKDQTEDVQIITNNKDETIYFWPIPRNTTETLIEGYFILDKQEAERFRDYISLPNVEVGPEIEYNFDGFYLLYLKANDGIISIAEGTGKYMDNKDRIDKFSDEILEFFDNDNVNFKDFSLSYTTDLKIPEEELNDLLLNAIGYYRDRSKTENEIYSPKVSSITGEIYYIVPMFMDSNKKHSLANFMIARFEDLVDQLDNLNDFDSKQIQVSDCIVLLIVSRQGKLEFVDLEINEYQKMSIEERREFVLDALNTIKNLNDSDPEQIKQDLIEKELLISAD